MAYIDQSIARNTQEIAEKLLHISKSTFWDVHICLSEWQNAEFHLKQHFYVPCMCVYNTTYNITTFTVNINMQHCYSLCLIHNNNAARYTSRKYRTFTYRLGCRLGCKLGCSVSHKDLLIMNASSVCTTDLQWLPNHDLTTVTVLYIALKKYNIATNMLSCRYYVRLNYWTATQFTMTWVANQKCWNMLNENYWISETTDAMWLLVIIAAP